MRRVQVVLLLLVGSAASVDQPASTGAPIRPIASDLVYGSFLGGGDEDYLTDIAVGADGSIYVTGQTSSPDFPTTPGAFDTTYNPGGFGGDVFVSKLDPTGSTLVYSTFLGGSDTDYGEALAVGFDGSVYIAGYTHAEDFPTTPGSYSPTWNGGCCDGFVANLNPTGSRLRYSTFLGGGSFEDIRSIYSRGNGVVHVTGQTLSADFPTTEGAFDRTLNNNGQEGYSDAFIAALNATGSGLAYSTFLGGQYNDYGYSVGLNRGGKPYVSGETQSSDFPTTPGAFDRAFNGGNSDAFVATLRPGGAGLRFSTFLGGSDTDGGNALAVDGGGAVYLVGWTSSPDFPTTPGAFDESINSFIFSDAFATKIDARGGTLGYSTYLGGANSDFGNDLGVGAGGTLTLVGTSYSANFPTTGDAFDRILGGPADAFVTRLNPVASSLMDSTFVGGTAAVIDWGSGIAVSGTATFVTGDTYSLDFPTTEGAYDTTYNGKFDGFVAALEIVTKGRG
jgi:hypothetical protein